MDSVLCLKRVYTESNICTYPFYKDPRAKYPKREKRSIEELETNIDGFDYLMNREELDIPKHLDPFGINIPSSNITGIYLHPLYGSYQIFEYGNITLWIQSENSYGIIYVQNTAMFQKDVFLTWIKPQEFSRTFVLRDSRFFYRSVDGQFHKLQILKDGPIYNRGN